MNRDEPVWITGVGAATPLGFELEEIERSLLEGRSGVSLVTRFPTDDYPSRIAAQLGRIPPPPGCDSRAFSARPRLEQLAHWCSERRCATRACGALTSRLALAWCSGLGQSGCCSGKTITSPAARGSSIRSRIALRPSSESGAGLGLFGPALALSAACASGNHALEIGRQWLRLGLVDCCVVGACDLAVSPLGPGDLRQPACSVAAEFRSCGCVPAV